MTDSIHTGSCLCGAVRYEVHGALRDVLLCHCAMCRKTHGHIGAYSAAPREALRVVESRGLRWYRSSPLRWRARGSGAGPQTRSRRPTFA